MDEEKEEAVDAEEEKKDSDFQPTDNDKDDDNLDLNSPDFGTEELLGDVINPVPVPEPEPKPEEVSEQKELESEAIELLSNTMSRTRINDTVKSLEVSNEVLRPVWASLKVNDPDFPGAQIP